MYEKVGNSDIIKVLGSQKYENKSPALSLVIIFPTLFLIEKFFKKNYKFGHY